MHRTGNVRAFSEFFSVGQVACVAHSGHDIRLDGHFGIERTAPDFTVVSREVFFCIFHALFTADDGGYVRELGHPGFFNQRVVGHYE